MFSVSSGYTSGKHSGGLPPGTRVLAPLAEDRIRGWQEGARLKAGVFVLLRK